MQVRDALLAARAAGVERLDAQLLLGRQLGRPRAWLIAHDDFELATADAEAFHAMLARRAAGEPLAYLLGEREFHGLGLRVTPAVLVPRPETEHLVEWALTLAPPGARVADLGTGSGAIALALKHARPDLDVTATDLSADALAVARANADRLALPLRLAAGPWWAPLAGERFELVVSNPPYIAGDDPHLAALTHEPEGALTPGGDGLDALREIVAGAATHVEPGGWLLLEHGHDQGPAVRALLQAAGWQQVQTRPDLAGLDRCSGARRPR
jgi:release factor glutamine methyltransferase